MHSIAGLSNGGMHISGCAKDGSPVIYVCLSKQVADAEVNMFCFVYMFERAIQMLPPQLNEYVLVIDCDGMGFQHVPPVSTVSAMSKIFGRHHPRRLGHVFVVFGGFLVNWAYDIISGYLPEVTKRKVNFVSGGLDEMRSRMGKRAYNSFWIF
jgi:hypothetical protein